MTAPAESLQINLADPADIRAKLPLAEKLMTQKFGAANAAQREAENWRLLVERLRVLAGPDQNGQEAARKPQDTRPARTSPSPSVAPAQAAVIRIVEREHRPMRPTEVANALRADGFPVKTTNAINSALYMAARKDRLKRMPELGAYAPLDWEPDQLPQNGASEHAEGVSAKANTP